MAKQNKVAVNLAQDFTDAEKAQARQNISATRTGYVDAVHTPPSTVYSDLYVVTQQSGLHLNNGNGNIAPLPPVVTQADTGKVLTVDNNGIKWKALPESSKLTTQVYEQNLSSWNSIRSLSSAISSGVQLVSVTLTNPITLNKDKTYLISTDLLLNVNQTKTVSESSTKSYLINAWLTDGATIDGTKHLRIGTAEIANLHTNTLDYPAVGGEYHASATGFTFICTPTVDITLTDFVLSNNGNINFGFNSSNPAILAMDWRLHNVYVTEIG